jgi:hypothetical protein
VFLLDIPRLEFAALIPKGDYVTMCLVGEKVDRELVQFLLSTPEVRQCFPPNMCLDQDFCHCSPHMSAQGAVQPFADRIGKLILPSFARFRRDAWLAVPFCARSPENNRRRVVTGA